MYDVDFGSLQLNIYTNYKINMIRERTVKYFKKGCKLGLLTALSFLIMCLFPWHIESFIKIMNIFLKLDIEMSRLINQSYVFPMVWVINQRFSEYEWIRVIKFQYCGLTYVYKISLVLMSSEKTINCWSRVQTSL